MMLDDEWVRIALTEINWGWSQPIGSGNSVLSTAPSFEAVHTAVQAVMSGVHDCCSLAVKLGRCGIDSLSWTKFRICMVCVAAARRTNWLTNFVLFAVKPSHFPFGARSFRSPYVYHSSKYTRRVCSLSGSMWGIAGGVEAMLGNLAKASQSWGTFDRIGTDVLKTW